jgi:hypothetical protein
MDTPYKLTVKIGAAEFTAEGDQSVVNEQFNLFLTALKYQPPPDPLGDALRQHGQDQPKGAVSNNGSGGASGSNGTATNGAQTDLATYVEPATMDRVFKVDADDVVSLHHLPTTPNAAADALVMLLYGFLKLTQSGAVSALTLMKGAVKSGVKIDRIDRVISANSQYITKGGARRGTRYGLNNRGELYAVGLIKKLLS